jgi:hypothetical protein
MSKTENNPKEIVDMANQAAKKAVKRGNDVDSVLQPAVLGANVPKFLLFIAFHIVLLYLLSSEIYLCFSHAHVFPIHSLKKTKKRTF